MSWAKRARKTKNLFVLKVNLVQQQTKVIVCIDLPFLPELDLLRKECSNEHYNEYPSFG